MAVPNSCDSGLVLGDQLHQLLVPTGAETDGQGDRVQEKYPFAGQGLLADGQGHARIQQFVWCSPD